MRLCTTISVIFLLSLTAHTTAWPHYASKRGLFDNLANIPETILKAAVDDTVAQLLLPLPLICPNFTVDHDKYPYEAPGPNDKRGPCPGLNALANHHYLPHNGIVTRRQLIRVCRCIVAFDIPLTLGLIIAGYFPTADLIKDQMSIGQPVDNPDDSSNPTRDLGLCHNTGIGKEASLVRTDLGLGGDCTVNVTLFNQLKMYGESSPDQWNPHTFGDASYARFLDSKQNNPKFVWEGFQIITVAVTTRIAYTTFPYGLPKINTLSQYLWFVQETMPTYFKKNPIELTITQIFKFLVTFLLDHPDPQWIARLNIPSSEDCYPCAFRFMIEDTFIGESNIFEPCYNMIAPYSQCVVLGCPRSTTTTTTALPTPSTTASPIPYTTTTTTTTAPYTTTTPTTTPTATPTPTSAATTTPPPA